MRRGIRVRTVTLLGLTETRKSNGKVYTYLRRKGQPLVRLPDLPHNHPDFLAAYIEAMKGGPDTPKLPAGTIGALCERAVMSARFKGLSEVYKTTLRRHFDEIRGKTGKVPARGLRELHIKIDVNSATSPTDRLKAWRFLAAIGGDLGLLEIDPTVNVKTPARPKTDGHQPWSLDDLDAFRARFPIGSAKRLAFELLLWTGARIGDAVKLVPGNVDRDGVLSFRQSKTGDMAYVPWACELPAYAGDMVTDRNFLHEALDARSEKQMTFLATEQGNARSDKALGTMIRAAAREAGIEKSAHGLRKCRAVLLADAEATTHQIAAWTGHHSLKEVEHYTLKANRRRAVMGTGAERKSAN